LNDPLIEDGRDEDENLGNFWRFLFFFFAVVLKTLQLNG